MRILAFVVVYLASATIAVGSIALTVVHLGVIAPTMGVLGAAFVATFGAAVGTPPRLADDLEPVGPPALRLVRRELVELGGGA